MVPNPHQAPKPQCVFSDKEAAARHAELTLDIQS